MSISMPRIRASLLYFAMVLGTGFILGVIRVPFLVPRIGERYAELLEMPIMFAVIVFSARHIIKRFKLSRILAVRLQVGFTALALTIAAELILAAVLQSQSVAEFIASRDPVSGSAYVLLLLVYALMPSLLMRFRESDNDRLQ
jgi:hypothetical protein